MTFRLIHELFVAVFCSLTLMHMYSYFLKLKIKFIYTLGIMIAAEFVFFFLSLKLGAWALFSYMMYPIIVLICYSGTVRFRLIYCFLCLFGMLVSMIGFASTISLALPDYIMNILNHGAKTWFDMVIDIGILALSYVLFNIIFRFLMPLFKKARIRDNRLGKNQWFIFLPAIQLFSYVYTLFMLFSKYLNNNDVHVIPLDSAFLTEFMLNSVIFLASFILDIFLFVTVNRNEKAKLIEYRYNELNNVLKSEYSYFMQINELYEKERSFTHDVKNKLIAVSDFIEGGNDSGALSIINELNGELSSFNRYHYCENELVNVVLSRKFDAAECLGIEVNCKIEINKIGVSDSDLCSVLSNILDNALDACRSAKLDKKYINFKMGISENYLIITCSNPYAGVIQMDENGLPITAKDDKTRHGFGVSILKELTEKYNGYLDIKTENGIFSIKAIFENPAEQSDSKVRAAGRIQVFGK